MSLSHPEGIQTLGLVVVGLKSKQNSNKNNNPRLSITLQLRHNSCKTVDLSSRSQSSLSLRNISLESAVLSVVDVDNVCEFLFLETDRPGMITNTSLS